MENFIFCTASVLKLFISSTRKHGSDFKDPNKISTAIIFKTITSQLLHPVCNKVKSYSKDDKDEMTKCHSRVFTVFRLTISSVNVNESAKNWKIVRIY